MDDERIAYLTLAQIPGVGSTRLATLLAACDTALGAHSAPLAFLCSVPGVSRAFATAIKQTPLDTGRRLAQAAEQAGARVLIAGDPDFPAMLATIPDPPPVLFAQGDLGLLGSPGVALVGSRDHSRYGTTVTHGLAFDAARAGVVVVSGMARGLDAVAHCAALEAGGGTIGVLGNGLGVIYPAANRALYERVAHRGLLLTEFPPGERPHAGSFPRRNRIISGLARVTVVLEAAVGSGALITAGSALDQGREVMAVPGPITSLTSVGCNRLIRDGAAPCLESADLLRHYPDAVALRQPPPASAPSSAETTDGGRQPEPALPDALSADERAVAELLAGEPVHVDALASRSGRPVGELLALLCALELLGVAEQRPGRCFRRA